MNSNNQPLWNKTLIALFALWIDEILVQDSKCISIGEYGFYATAKPNTHLLSIWLAKPTYKNLIPYAQKYDGNGLKAIVLCVLFANVRTTGGSSSSWCFFGAWGHRFFIPKGGCTKEGVSASQALIWLQFITYIWSFKAALHPSGKQQWISWKSCPPFCYLLSKQVKLRATMTSRGKRHSIL